MASGPKAGLYRKGACTNHVDKRGGRGVPQMTTTLNNCYLVKVSAKGEKGGQKYQKISTQTFKQHSPRIYPHIIRRFQRFGSMLSIISLSGENVLYESNIELFFLTSSRIYHFQLIEQMDT